MPSTQADADGKGNPVTSEWQHTANDEPSDSDRCEKSQAAQREAYEECPATNDEATVVSLCSSAFGARVCVCMCGCAGMHTRVSE